MSDRAPENVRPILLEFGESEHYFIVLSWQPFSECSRLHNNGWSSLQRFPSGRFILVMILKNFVRR